MNNTLLQKINSNILSIFLKIIVSTSKIIIHGHDNLHEIKKNNYPMMICVWHGRLLFPCMLFKKLRLNPWVIASRHHDAQMIVNIFKKWNFKLIRGSSKKKGDTVIKKMKKIFIQKENNWIGVTNDGPKGPAQLAKLGSLIAAIDAKANIVSITGAATKYWEFKTWDKFILPKPFSTIHINISKPLDYENINQQDIIDAVSQYMNNSQNESDRFASST